MALSYSYSAEDDKVPAPPSHDDILKAVQYIRDGRQLITPTVTPTWVETTNGVPAAPATPAKEDKE
jgi:hypothetical protein